MHWSESTVLKHRHAADAGVTVRPDHILFHVMLLLMFEPFTRDEHLVTMMTELVEKSPGFGYRSDRYINIFELV